LKLLIRKNLQKATFFSALLICSIISVGFSLQSNPVVASSGSIHYPSQYAFGIVGSVSDASAINNFCWLFGNQSITYKVISPISVKNSADLQAFDGLVVFTKQASGYNATAIKQFAKVHVVISNTRDFCKVLYTSLNSSLHMVSTDKISYLKNWGNFQNGDIVDMRNETGNIDQLTAVLSTGLAHFSNITNIARYNTSNIVLFYMNGTVDKSGFFVMDLDATTPDTQWTGIWHVFPAVKMVRDFPTGTYSLWMANGTSWWNLDWVYNQVKLIAGNNSDLVKEKVIGHSVQGREMLAMFIGNGSRYAIIDGSIHGNEKTGTFACLRTAELLIQYYRSDPYWKSRLTQYTVIIVPVVNPDGFVHNTRDNANKVNLNRQFPPDGNTTEPEAWAIRYLMGNYTPTIYINMHEGGRWYPLHMIYGEYEHGANRTLTINAMQEANQTFVSLHHYGWYTENSLRVWIGKVGTIVAGGGEPGMATDYASWKCGTSCMLLETFVWSNEWGARKCLWGLDYYPAVIVSFLRNIER
jgi:hypothetical protein